MASVEGHIGVGLGEGEARRKISAGAELDFLTKAELDASLQPLTEQLRRSANREKPTIQEVSAKGTANAAGAVTIDVGAPSASRTWDVRRVGVTGIDPTITVACQVRSYRVEPSNPLRMVDVGTQVPSVATYSRGQFNLKPEEHLFLVVTGFTAGADVFVNLSAEETTWGKPEEYTL